jgi:two-component system, NtrC family, sensor kinase
MTMSETSRVLLVDDTEQNRYVLSRILARAGLQVEQCTTGKEALEREKSCPDLVILDVKLPDLSGYEVCASRLIQSRAPSLCCKFPRHS